MSTTEESVSALAIQTRNLCVQYRRFLRPAVDALDGLNLSVSYGEVFGFLGPNGAGKSTAIKTLLGLVFARTGSAQILGRPAGSLEARRRIGYLPEVALYYPYLKASEMLAM
ncbi:MAG TPA: ATP-binding cassette domain-containing protein, partial [bacterium]|nr:ATP-binding cassette domain-containing protein [bacterium]